MTWIGGCLVAALLIGALIGSVFSRKREDAERDQSHADKLDYPATTNPKTSIAALASAQIAAAKDSYAAAKDDAADRKSSLRISFWTAVGVSIYTVFTLVIVVFNVVQYGETHRFNKKQIRLTNSQLDEMHTTLVMSQRPWLYIEGNVKQNVGSMIDNGVIFEADIINMGNAIATGVEMSDKIERRQYRGITNNKINSENIPCQFTADYWGRTRTYAIPPKRDELINFITPYTLT